MAETNKNAPNSEESYLAEPRSGDEYYQRGWRYYADAKYAEAEADLRKALADSPNHPDILYALGLTLMAGKKGPEAIQAFQKVIQALENPAPEMHNRAAMLTRLAQGHINKIQTGDWGHLESHA